MMKKAIMKQKQRIMTDIINDRTEDHEYRRKSRSFIQDKTQSAYYIQKIYWKRSCINMCKKF